MSSKLKTYDSILGDPHGGVYMVDGDRRITYWSRSAERLTGYTNDEVIGKCCADNILMHVDDEGLVMCATSCPLVQCMTDGSSQQERVHMKHADGHRVAVAIRATPITDSHGKVVGAMQMFKQKSPACPAAPRGDELKRLGSRLAVTGVGSKAYTVATILPSLTELQNYGMRCGLLLIAVDHLQNVNVEFGHGIGDKVLQMVATTLRCGIRSSDLLGHWEGDRFIVAALNVGDEGLLSLANRLRIMTSTSRITVGEGVVRITVSVGATIVHKHENIHAVVQRAEELVRQSKLAGRNRVSFCGGNGGTHQLPPVLSQTD